MTLNHSNSLRRGGAYVAVLALSMVVTVMAVGAIAIVRAQARGNDALGDAAEARLYAHSAIELGRLWISQDSSWRTNRPNGTWVSNQSIGNGTFTLEATDPIDGNIRNRPHDPLVLKATAHKGSATQILQVTLAAQPLPLPALAYALHTGGEFHVNSGKQFNTGFATISTNGALRNQGLVVGSIEAMTNTLTGSVTGTVTIPSAIKSFPPASVLDLYTLLGTEINPGDKLDKDILTTGYCAYGTPNAEGVYIIRPSSDFEVRRTRVNGTLVIICNAGKKVTFRDEVFIQPYRSDYPGLIVYGNVDFQNTPSSTSLSESTNLTNYNPIGAPYLGVTDSDQSDNYPNEIQGLVHVYGTTTFTSACTIRGLLLCESTAAADAVPVNANAKIIYTSSLYTTPPQGYTSSVPMVPQTTTWLKIVN